MRKKKKSVCWTVFCHNTRKKQTSPCLSWNVFFLSSVPYLYSKFLLFIIQKCWYIFLSDAPAPWKCLTVFPLVLRNSVIPRQSGKTGLAFRLLTSAFVWIGSSLGCSCCSRKFCAHDRGVGLYPGGGVWVWVGQGVVLPTAREGVEGVERGESTDGARDHSDGVRCHERDVVWWAPHG